MKNDIQQLLKQKKNLQEQRMIAEIGNDTYYSSPQYLRHQQLLHELNRQIENLRQKCDKTTI